MPLVVDFSVWIDYFNGHHTPETDILDHALGLDGIIMGDLKLQTHLQGRLV